MPGEAIFTANAGAPVAGNACRRRAVDLPLVARGESAPTPGTWITVMEEGFEAAPGPLWQFRDDNGAVGGAYQVGPARIACRTPAVTAPGPWAAVDGEKRPCGDAYPDNVQTTMIYGPFSLVDAEKGKRASSCGTTRCWTVLSPGGGHQWRYVSRNVTYGEPSEWTTLDLDLHEPGPV